MNKCLIGIDVTRLDPAIVVVRPPLSLSKEDSLTFAAHLFAYASAALVEAKREADVPKLGQFAGSIDRAALRGTANVQRDTVNDEVIFTRRVQSLGVAEAFALAAEVVACADQHADMGKRIAAVVGSHRNGVALNALLHAEGEMKLGVPLRSRISAPVPLESSELDDEDHHAAHEDDSRAHPRKIGEP